MNSPNAQAYNHTNATIIRIWMTWKERGRDFENYGIRITWLGVMVEKIWRKEVVGLKYEFGRF
jgi:hypothetical protein